MRAACRSSTTSNASTTSTATCSPRRAAVIDHTPDEGIEEDAVLDEADPECVRLRAAFGRPMPSVVPMVTLLNGAIVNRRLEWIWSVFTTKEEGPPRSRTGRSAPSGASGSTTG